MRHIKKQSEPRELTEYRNSGGKWDDFSLEKGKKAVKNQLLAEQNCLCAYCTGAINFDNMKVEHWYPQAEDEKKELEYNNLLAVCFGCYNQGEFFHCDTSKADTIIQLSPTNTLHIDTTDYEKASGGIKSSNPIFQQELDETLNLNIAPLKKARKTRLYEFRKALNKKYPNKTANYQKELNKWSNLNISHNIIVVKYLEKKLR
mgnify:FL=1